MTANIHIIENAPFGMEAKLVNGFAWLTTFDGSGNQMTTFFRPADIARIMGQVEKALGELESIAHTMDLSAAELAPAGHSEQDGAFALPGSRGGETVVSFRERN